MKIIKKESNKDSSKASRAIRKLKYIQNEISEAIKYLESDKDCIDATCDAANELYRADELANALAKDAQMNVSAVKAESTDNENKDDEDERFRKAWDSIGFHGDGGTYSAEEFLDKVHKAANLKWDKDSIRELEKRKAELEHNAVSHNIPDTIDTLLQDIAQTTNIISYNDIIKFGDKLSQSEQYRKYALGGIEHLIDRWGEAIIYEDELTMNDIAHDVKSYMTYPIQKTVTKESTDVHRESFRLNNVVFSVMFDGDSVSMKSHHPYDEANYHYAVSKDGGEHFSIYIGNNVVEEFAPQSFEEDEESGIKYFNWREVSRELLRLDKNVESRMMNN